MRLEVGWVCGRPVELIGRDATTAEEGDQAMSVDAKGDGRSKREKERNGESEGEGWGSSRGYSAINYHNVCLHCHSTSPALIGRSNVLCFVGLPQQAWKYISQPSVYAFTVAISRCSLAGGQRQWRLEERQVGLVAGTRTARPVQVAGGATIHGGRS
ncbi:hypothetical protein MUK42_11328 [Musa troglodytarum]|uniref:Uncharacterized protein n=1 Tax=Musa troglodytarum TaxID=320322 RepID=A0A9E7GT66_9LILI|nr:hypothetical protein MUK42_11328 [Musa troglodytarum]